MRLPDLVVSGSPVTILLCPISLTMSPYLLTVFSFRPVRVEPGRVPRTGLPFCPLLIFLVVSLAEPSFQPSAYPLILLSVSQRVL